MTKIDTGRSGVWLTHLIEATEVVAASVEPCDAAIVNAFGRRLEVPAEVHPMSDFVRKNFRW
jgi:hypothetical protein